MILPKIRKTTRADRLDALMFAHLGPHVVIRPGDRYLVAPQHTRTHKRRNPR